MKILLKGLLVFWLPLLLVSCDKDKTNEPVYFAIGITADEGGTVDVASGDFLSGSTVTLTATPQMGYEFVKWSGGLEATTPKLSFTVDRNMDIHAQFKAIESTFVSDNVPLLIEDKVDGTGYILAIVNGGNQCFLLDHKGEKIFDWEFDKPLGQDIELTPEGNLLGLFKADSSPVGFGGQSGIIRLIDKAGTVLWEYILATENEITHHDLTLMPNGNVLVLVWERIINADAIAVGIETDGDVFTEKVVEIDPSTNSVVWEWRSWDHIVQNFNDTLSNFGDPAVMKNKININYPKNEIHEFVAAGDLMHINGLDYLPEQDIIALSVNFYSEVWFIDHNTTTAEAKTGSGGQFDRGGDLLYRFGNQKVFGNAAGSQIFDFNHHSAFGKHNGQNSLTVFNNNNAAGNSIAMEFVLPEINGTTPIGTDPEIVFEFTDSTLFFPRVGSVQRLPNGNVLICEGDYGFWEVTNAKETVWKYDGLGTSFWRAIFYAKDSDAIQNLNL